MQTGAAPAAKPTRPAVETPFTTLFGPVLHNRDGHLMDTTELAGKMVGVYFSAQWNPSCRFFTPRLAAFHRHMSEAGRPFEVVLVSWDRSEDNMFIYMREFEMPWLAIPWHSLRRTALAREYAAHEIPLLIIFNADAQPVSREGRSALLNRGMEAFDEWLLH